MAGVNNVVTRGYSIGTIALVVLRGFTSDVDLDLEQTIETSGLWSPTVTTSGEYSKVITTSGQWT